MKHSRLYFILCLFLLVNTHLHCYRMRNIKGGGQTKSNPQRIISPGDISLHPGYTIEPFISGLNFPTAISFDDNNRLYVVEAGYSYGELWDEPRLLQIDSSGKPTVLAKGTDNGPWTGATWHDGAFYVAEGGQKHGGKILKITQQGTITTLLADLPSFGDHHTNGPVIKDGYIYFGQGTATNSAVVGKDNADFGWLLRKNGFHDIPCKDIILSGENFTTDGLAGDSNQKVTTGAYVPFGQSTTAGQVIKGSIPCSGSICKIPLAGGKPMLVAWGLRNPFGLAVAPNGKFFITENGFDERGSRPVWGAGDVLWEITEGQWYGWPDFSAGIPIAGNKEFKSPGNHLVKPLLKQYPNDPPKPAAILGVHSSSNGLDFSGNPAFGFEGEAFVAQFGDMAPSVGKVLFPVGFKIVRVNVETGVVRDFAVNKGKRNGPASWLEKGGLERPVAVRFDRSGQALYVVDFGILKMTNDGPQPQKNTGVIWKITKKNV